MWATWWDPQEIQKREARFERDMNEARRKLHHERRGGEDVSEEELEARMRAIPATTLLAHIDEETAAIELPKKLPPLRVAIAVAVVVGWASVVWTTAVVRGAQFLLGMHGPRAAAAQHNDVLLCNGAPTPAPLVALAITWFADDASIFWRFVVLLFVTVVLAMGRTVILMFTTACFLAATRDGSHQDGVLTILITASERTRWIMLYGMLTREYFSFRNAFWCVLGNIPVYRCKVAWIRGTLPYVLPWTLDVGIDDIGIPIESYREPNLSDHGSKARPYVFNCCIWAMDLVGTAVFAYISLGAEFGHSPLLAVFTVVVGEWCIVPLFIAMWLLCIPMAMAWPTIVCATTIVAEYRELQFYMQHSGKLDMLEVCCGRGVALILCCGPTVRPWLRFSPLSPWGPCHAAKL